MKQLRQSIATLMAWAATTMAVMAADVASDDCMTAEGDRQIAGCTEVLRRDSEISVERAMIPAKRAIILSNRGVAYYLKGDWDRAIADYSEAIRADSNFIAAFINRGTTYYSK